MRHTPTLYGPSEHLGIALPRPTLVHIGVARRGRVSGPDRTTTRAPEVHPMTEFVDQIRQRVNDTLGELAEARQAGDDYRVQVCTGELESYARLAAENVCRRPPKGRGAPPSTAGWGSARVACRCGQRGSLLVAVFLSGVLGCVVARDEQGADLLHERAPGLLDDEPAGRQVPRVEPDSAYASTDPSATRTRSSAALPMRRMSRTSGRTRSITCACRARTCAA